MWLGLTILSVGIVWGLQLWSIQTARGGSGSNCDHGIYSAIGVSAWICVAIFVLIVVYIVLIVLGKVENPKTKRAEAEAARAALDSRDAPGRGGRRGVVAQFRGARAGGLRCVK